MITAIANNSRWRMLAWRAALGITGLWVVANVIWLAFLPANSADRGVASFALLLKLAALFGLAWAASRARADRRWQTAWERYAELEEARSRAL